MAERKVVQIAAADVAYMALCDDGTMWQLSGRDWDQLPPIPQPQGEAGDALFELTNRLLGRKQ